MYNVYMADFVNEEDIDFINMEHDEIQKMFNNIDEKNFLLINEGQHLLKIKGNANETEFNEIQRLNHEEANNYKGSHKWKLVPVKYFGVDFGKTTIGMGEEHEQQGYTTPNATNSIEDKFHTANPNEKFLKDMTDDGFIIKVNRKFLSDYEGENERKHYNKGDHVYFTIDRTERVLIPVGGISFYAMKFSNYTDPTEVGQTPKMIEYIKNDRKEFIINKINTFNEWKINKPVDKYQLNKENESLNNLYKTLTSHRKEPSGGSILKKKKRKVHRSRKLSKTKKSKTSKRKMAKKSRKASKKGRKTRRK